MASANDVGEAIVDNMEKKPVSSDLSHGEMSQDPLTDSAKSPASKRSDGIIQQKGIEQGFYKHFMNPMLSKMEDNMQENIAILDEINKKMEDDRLETEKKELSKHIPETLQGNGQELKDVIKNIENLIVYNSYDLNNSDEAEFTPARLRKLDENGQVAVLSHSVAAYVSTLESSHLRHFTTKIVQDTTLWISRLFRMNDGITYFHEEDREGLVKICRLALLKKYPRYATDGYEALYSRPPVIYVSSASRPSLGEYLCHQLGLPLSCLCTVPTNTRLSSLHKIDISVLEKLIQDDVTSGKIPLLLIGNAGTPMLGHVDNIDALQEVCKKNQIWLHLEGNNLAALTMYHIPSDIQAASACDSMTLNLGCWLGLPAVPFVTLYRACEPTLARAAGLTLFNAKYKLPCVALWICLQNLGIEGVVKRVKYTIDLAKMVQESIKKNANLQDVSKPRKPPRDPNAKPGPITIGSLIFKAISRFIVFEENSSTVVFRYQKGKEIPDETTNDAKVNGEEVEPEPEVFDQNPHIDALNIWLCETLRRDVPNVHLALTEVDGVGVCIRFAPMESAYIYETKEEDVEQVMTNLDRQLSIVNATVRQKINFEDIVEAQDNMRLIHLSNWAGVGAVQYIPETWVDKLDELSELGKQEISALNSDLVHHLKASDLAFSPGHTEEGLLCVRFGLITDETDLEELIARVYATGQEVEKSSKFLDTMADVVRQGIEKASEDLVKENQDKLAQEGVLRQVPLVGSLMNWWSPIPKESGMRGRMFHLASGQIESTEPIYKNHMQVQKGSSIPDVSPMEGPLKSKLKPAKVRRGTHGRSASDTSGTSVDTIESGNHPETKVVKSNDKQALSSLGEETKVEVAEESITSQGSSVNTTPTTNGPIPS